MKHYVAAPEWVEASPDHGSSAWTPLCACYVGGKVVAFGTEHTTAPHTYGTPTHSLRVYIYHNKQWCAPETIHTPPGTTTPPPTPRYIRGCNANDTHAVLLWLPEDSDQLHLSTFCLSTMTWGCSVTDLPPRVGYNVCTVGGVLFSFGGAQKRMCQPSFHTINLSTGVSRQCVERGGVSPKPRAYHAQCRGPNETIIIHGGIGDKGEMLQDLWSYDTQRMRWMEVSCRIHLSKHAVATSPSWIAMYGGALSSTKCNPDLFVYDVAVGQWAKAETQHRTPTPRLYPLLHSTDETPVVPPRPHPRVSQNSRGAEFVMFGGEGVSDLWMLRLRGMDADMRREGERLRAKDVVLGRIGRRTEQYTAEVEERRGRCEVLTAEGDAVEEELRRLASLRSQIDDRTQSLDNLALHQRRTLHAEAKASEAFRGAKLLTHRMSDAAGARAGHSAGGVGGGGGGEGGGGGGVGVGGVPPFVELPRPSRPYDADQRDIEAAQRRAAEHLLEIYENS